MHAPQATAVSSQLISYHFFENRDAFQLPKDIYNYWALFICEKGDFNFQLGKDEGVAQPGDLILCPPHVMFHRKASQLFSFHFATFHLRSFRQAQQIDFPYRGKFSFHDHLSFAKTLRFLKTSFQQVSKSYTEHLLNDMLYQIIREKADLNDRKAPADSTIANALRYIHARAFQKISVESVADHVGYSRAQFSKKFCLQLGVTPSQYIVELRLQQVCKLLIETDDTLEQIAEQSGFKNAFYLSRVFTQHMNMNPSLYRKSHRV